MTRDRIDGEMTRFKLANIQFGKAQDHAQKCAEFAQYAIETVDVRLTSRTALHKAEMHANIAQDIVNEILSDCKHPETDSNDLLLAIDNMVHAARHLGEMTAFTVTAACVEVLRVWP